jgi:hypothetical protein
VPSKIWSGRGYWSSEPMMYNHRTGEMVAERRKIRAAVSKSARDRIAVYRSKPETLAYVRGNWEASDRVGWWSHHRHLGRLLGIQLLHMLGRRQGPPPKPAIQIAFEHYRQPWLKWRQSRCFTRMSGDELQDLRYVFLAFHKDPEQALNYQAPFWVSQYNTASLISGALPAGYKLLVREHRLNAGRRNSEFYRELLRLPQLVLIDAFDDQFKYISNADLIVTDNGSTGWEGLMLGRRVLTLADNFYQAAGLAKRIREPEQMAEEIVEILGKPEMEDKASYDKALGWLIDAEWETTAPLEDGGHAQSLDLLARIYSAGQTPGVKAESLPA